jgi:predicted nucleic acid-binding protein
MLASLRHEGRDTASARVGLCELAVGINQTQRRESNWKALRVFLRQIRIWPVELSTAVAYGDLYNELKGKGRVLSQVDMMIAALARRMDLVVLTTDRDFEALPDIVTENWIQESS